MELTLLTDWRGSDPAGWIVQEKLDGWRLTWTGREYLLRSGSVLDVPSSWKDGMPDCVLDGELFAGRGAFYAIQRRIKAGFGGLTFQVFDAPSAKPFVQRLKALDALSLPAHCRVVPWVRCKDEAHWLALADEILALGGEGIVGRPAKSIHKTGRDHEAQRWVPVDPQLTRQSVEWLEKKTPAQLGC